MFYTFLPLIRYENGHFPKKVFWPFDATQGSRGGKRKLFACMVFYALFPFIGYATWLLSEKKYIGPVTPSPQG